MAARFCNDDFVICQGIASLTAPNGKAQQGLLRGALANAVASADSLAAAEFHGTGTTLGDPIEAGAFACAILSSRSSSSTPVGIGGVKVSVGHAEPAVGKTALVWLVAEISRGTSTPNAQRCALMAQAARCQRSSWRWTCINLWVVHIHAWYSVTMIHIVIHPRHSASETEGSTTLFARAAVVSARCKCSIPCVPTGLIWRGAPRQLSRPLHQPRT